MFVYAVNHLVRPMPDIKVECKNSGGKKQDSAWRLLNVMGNPNSLLILFSKSKLCLICC